MKADEPLTEPYRWQYRWLNEYLDAWNYWRAVKRDELLTPAERAAWLAAAEEWLTTRKG